MAGAKSEIMRGTLDLMALTTPDTMGPLHGDGMARPIEQVSDDALPINQGTIFASLVGLSLKRRIPGTRGTSDHNRKATIFGLTKAGRRQLRAEARNWDRFSAPIGRVLRAAERG
jgi:PadR family transcriptional regulator